MILDLSYAAVMVFNSFLTVYEHLCSFISYPSIYTRLYGTNSIKISYRYLFLIKNEISHSENIASFQITLTNSEIKPIIDSQCVLFRNSNYILTTVLN